MSENRRQYFRLDDKVAINIRSLSAEEQKKHIDNFSATREQFSLPNLLLVKGDEQLPLWKQIKKKYPDIAAYFQFIEYKFDLLLNLLIKSDHVLPLVADTYINLSAQGLALKTDKGYKVGDLVEIKLMLFPEKSQMLLLAEVVKSEKQGDQFFTAFNFSHIHEEDKETIARHIHARQLDKIYSTSEYYKDE